MQVQFILQKKLIALSNVKMLILPFTFQYPTNERKWVESECVKDVYKLNPIEPIIAHSAINVF
jgi:hypothetical protein